MPILSVAQLPERFVALEREFAQHHIKMALYVDKLEQQLEDADKNIRRVPLRAVVSGTHMPYRDTMPGFSEHRPDI